MLLYFSLREMEDKIDAETPFFTCVDVQEIYFHDGLVDIQFRNSEADVARDPGIFVPLACCAFRQQSLQ